jgi:N-acetylneuraminic acid mutarotase
VPLVESMKGIMRNSLGVWVLVSVATAAASLSLAAPAAAQETWTVTAPMSVARYRHTATLLPDGRVLVTGGVDTPIGSPNVATVLATAEIYSPISNTWIPAASMSTAREGHVATLLANGRVLVAGGFDANSNSLETAELYDPGADTWTTLAPMTVPRALPTVNTLVGGRVLVTGGFNVPESDPYAKYLASAEVYDPNANTWTAVPSMSVPRVGHTATLLPNGQVLVVSGCNYAYCDPSVQIFDPASASWLAAPSLDVARIEPTATALADGRVIVAGGDNPTIPPLTSTEIYDPVANSWSPGPASQVGRRAALSAMLPNGRVLVVGGYSNSDSSFTVFSSAEIYDPATGGWSLTPDMGAARYVFAATALADGRVLVTGGFDGTESEASTEIWGPTLTATTATGIYGGTTTVTATLSARSGATTAGQTISFALNGTAVGTAITDVNGTATLTGVSLSGLAAGTTPAGVVATFAGNSQIPALTGTAALIITPAPLTITANNATKVVDATNPASTVSYATFVAGDGPGALSGALTFTTTATAASPVGTYSVTPGGLTSNNYQITFVPGTLTVVYNLCALFDQTAAHKSGSTVPIKLALCDVANANVSSASVPVVATAVFMVSTNAPGPLDDSGDANPDNQFRFAGGSYIFNLSLKGYSQGTYTLVFQVGTSPTQYSVQFQVK